MLREPLRNEASSLISVALRNQAHRIGRWHKVALPIGNQVRLQAFPFANQQGSELQCLLAIEARFEEAPSMEASAITENDQRAYVERMEHEIRATQEALQQTIEELQTANEELQSSNEELQSTNEEFQATKVELETANEELQSTNEELLTVNEELQISSNERLTLASELEATMKSAPYAVALVDQALVLRRVSDKALEMFSLEELPLTGLHLSQCDLPEGFPSLAPLANTALRLQETKRLSVISEFKHFSVVLSPVHDIHRKLMGLSITITEFEDKPLQALLDMMESMSGAAHWSYNIETKVLLWSPSMFSLLKMGTAIAVPSWDDMLGMIDAKDRETVSKRLDTLMRDGESYEADLRMKNGAGEDMQLKSSALLMRRIDELHMDYPFAGSRMMKGLLRQEGFTVGRLHVATCMKRMGVQGRYPKLCV